MKWHHLLVQLLVPVTVAGLLIPGLTAEGEANTGSRPQSVAVSPDGKTILATSMGSSFLSHKRNNKFTHISLPAPSWGVCIVDDVTAVVTHPTTGQITLLTRSNANKDFAPQPPLTINVNGTDLYPTEVIKSPDPGSVLVAHRGQAPDGAEIWQHAVYEIDYTTGAATRTFITEREPRALCLSPDGTRLFVGHAQGALGGTGVATNFFDKTPPVHDGGTVVMFDMVTQGPLARFPIGSPVRGLTVWPSPDAPATARITSTYRVFVSSVGDGAQSEAPGHGGRAIPNVISGLHFDLAHTPLSRTNAVFEHNPDYDPTTAQPVVAADLPAIVHDRMITRWEEPQTGVFEWELWVANAGSGTVSRADLDPTTGAIVTSGTVNISQAPGESFEVVSGKGATGEIDTDQMVTANASNATIVFDQVANPLHVNVDLESRRVDPGLAFAANPTDIAYDGTLDRIYVVTQLDHQLVRIDLGVNQDPTGRSHQSLLNGTDPVLPEERNFFTFGRGFDFREFNTAKVQTQACITCHVGGHLDGKVRNTVVQSGQRFGNNGHSFSEFHRPVAVPSVFDVGSTEWIFFEGLRTIRDGTLGDPGCQNGYCLDTQIFSDTDGFTNVVQTPSSPYFDTELSAVQQAGRFYFQKMNCTRCHNGAPAIFRRTNVVSTPEAPLQTDGPLPQDLLAGSSRLLHDMTQSFITDFDGSGPFDDVMTGDDVSFRNMTDVGTRDEDTFRRIVTGVNTPALAGAWDNAPYFHDGRYRTLEEVLDHTWLDPADEHRAAPLFPALAAPRFLSDNALNTQLINMSLPGPLQDDTLHPFFTHAPASVGGRVTARSWLDAQPPLATGESATTALLSFLRAVSSQSDLCPDITISGFQAAFPGGCTQTRMAWSTSALTECEVTWSSPSGAPGGTTTTPAETNHILYIPTVGGTDYDVTITVNVLTTPLANSPVCQNPPEPITPFFTTASCSPPRCPPDCHELEGERERLVHQTAFLGASPNPVSSSTRLVFALAEAQRVRIQVFDVVGRLVGTPVDGELPPGWHEIDWSPDDHIGRDLPPGIYYLVMRTRGFEGKKKLVLLH